MTAPVALILASAVLLPLLPACGSGDNAEEDVADDIVALQQALARDNLRDVCDRLSARAQRQIGTVGHDKQPTTCPADLRLFLTGLQQSAPLGTEGGDLTKTRRPRVVTVTVHGGDAATAVLALGREQFDVPLVNDDDVWKLDDFFGAVGPPAPGLR